jgi:transcriptional regulator with XRE-family HTH domain
VIGATLKKIRTIYGYTATEMKDELDISASYLSEIERDHKKPTYKILERYSEITGIKLSSLLLLSEEFDEAEKKGTSRELIRGMMQGLIDTMAKDQEEKDYEELKH